MPRVSAIPSFTWAAPPAGTVWGAQRAELCADSLDDRPAVQVGDPFLERVDRPVWPSPAARGRRRTWGCGDLQLFEMAAKGRCGLDRRVPAREQGMTAYEFLLSESQERMLFVVKAGREEA